MFRVKIFNTEIDVVTFDEQARTAAHKAVDIAAGCIGSQLHLHHEDNRVYGQDYSTVVSNIEVNELSIPEMLELSIAEEIEYLKLTMSR